MPDDRPIGVFDSGVGGLTVVRAIGDLAPGERIRYLGDTARAPYGPRSVAEIRGFALEIADHLVRSDTKMLVVACNSVEVSAITEVTEAHGVPVVGVIAPGIRAATRATRSGRVGLIGTQATVASGAYDRAVADAGAAIELVAAACPVFVDHVEAGDTTSPELRAAAGAYLAPLLAAEVDTLILGCTHYPMLAPLLRDVVGPGVVLVSSADETARDVAAALDAHDLRRTEETPPTHEFRCTGDPAGFRAIAERFLGPDAGSFARAVLGVEGVAWT